MIYCPRWRLQVKIKDFGKAITKLGICQSLYIYHLGEFFFKSVQSEKVLSLFNLLFFGDFHDIPSWVSFRTLFKSSDDTLINHNNNNVNFIYSVCDMI